MVLLPKLGLYFLIPVRIPLSVGFFPSTMLGTTHLKHCCWFTSWLPYGEVKETPKTRADHPRWVGGRFKKQGNLLMRLLLGGHDEQISTPACQILEVYIEALTGSVMNTIQKVSIPPYSLKAMSLGQLPL